MAVDSYLELFTTLFGWQFYGVVWDALASVGIVFIPFIVLVVRNWMEPAKAGDYHNIWATSLKRMEIEFYLAVFVAIIAGVPALPLTANTLSYAPPAALTGPRPTATIAAPQSTYGSGGAFAGAPGSVALPIWWYTVLTLSKGFNHAIIAGMPSEAGIRQLQQQAQLATIPDPQLREEAGQFFNDCYLPARSAYLREKPSGAAITALLNEYGSDDPEWMGSHVYRALYYPTLRSQRRVVGWAYSPARDRDYDPSIAHVWGQPWCSQWWDDAAVGLRRKISNAANGVSSIGTHLGAAVAALAADYPALTNAAEKTTDWTARAALDNARVGAISAYQPDSFGGSDNTAYGNLQALAGTFGAAYNNFTTGTMLTTLKPMLPIAQALILMAVYALLPLIVVFSSYSLAMVVAGAIGIFTINFWTVLWKLGQWADENLIQAMHSGTMDGLLAWASTAGGAGGAFGGAAGATSKAILFDTMLAVFMIGMPLLWSGMMAWIGMNAMKALSTNVLNDSTSPAGEAGRTGANLGGRVVTGGLKGR